MCCIIIISEKREGKKWIEKEIIDTMKMICLQNNEEYNNRKCWREKKMEKIMFEKLLFAKEDSWNERIIVKDQKDKYP